MRVAGPTSKPRLRSLLTTLLLLGAVSCGGDDPMDIVATASDLLGTWNITSLVHTPVGGGTPVEEVVAGLSGSVVFRQDLTYTIAFQDAGPPVVSESENGTYMVTGSSLTITPDNAPLDVTTLEIQSLTSNGVTLYQADDDYDFDDDGTDDPATTTVRLEK